MNKYLKGSLLIVMAMVLFATIGIFVRHIDMPNPVIIFFTSLFASIVLLTYFAIKGRLKGLVDVGHKKTLFVSGILVSFTILLYFMAYSNTTLANAVLTHYTAPIFAALLAPFYLKEKLSKVTIFALAISFAGLIVITSDSLSFGSPDLLGIVYGVFSGLFYGLLILVDKKLLKDIDSKVVLVYQVVIPTFFMAPFLFIFDFSLTAFNLSLILVYVFALIITGTLLYFAGLKHVKAQDAGIISYIEPVTVFIFGFLFFNEIPSIRTYIGGALILYSGYLIIKTESERR
ncbi:MAG: DMT family transporter [Candidatus Woesearchaeota archaeon]|jgi:drug/metabolite transporter (DMT)-like permease|nr:DMT family transporter [Candidatus Woesearchaeota archaeon]